MNELGIRIEASKVIFTGSIEAVHPFDPEADKIDIRLSDGTAIKFRVDKGLNRWIISPSHKEYYEINSEPKVLFERSYEDGINEKVLFKYHISNALVCVDGLGIKRYGTKVMSRDQQQILDRLTKYLTSKGFLCVEEIKTDLIKIITQDFEVTESQDEEN